MVAFTSLVFVVRHIIQIQQRKTFEAQDSLLYVAFIAYLSSSRLYVITTPIFFKIKALQKGKIAPWSSIAKDLKFASEIMWSSGMVYWTRL